MRFNHDAWTRIDPLNVGCFLAMWSLTTKVDTMKSSSFDDESSDGQKKLLKKVISVVHGTLWENCRTLCGRGGAVADECLVGRVNAALTAISKPGEASGGPRRPTVEREGVASNMPFNTIESKLLVAKATTLRGKIRQRR